MNETPKTKSGWRILRRILVGIAVLATLIALFYVEEDWRGKRAWEKCKRELEAKGAVLDLDALIPPPVPDGQNFFKAPKMTAWFVRNRQSDTNELNVLVTNADKVAVITNKTAASNFLTWSDQFEPDFDLIREALKRPYARMDGDYRFPSGIPIPNFINVRAVAQVLAQRAKCDLLLGQPDKALQELTLMHDFRHLLEAAPSGKPMTLVAAMINVAVSGLYVDTVADGLQKHAWQELQLVALQGQLADMNLTPLVLESFRMEQSAVTGYEPADLMYGTTNLWQKLQSKAFWLFDIAPRGWTYQNMVVTTKLYQKLWDGVEAPDDIFLPKKIGAAMDEVVGTMDRHSPFVLLSRLAIPNFSRAVQTTAHNQTMVNEAQIACALERYHLAHGEYPETLDALTPQFIEKIPHDIIGGQPLHYRRTDDGKFLLYSVGWNEADDGGQENLPPTIYSSIDYTKGDWVWKN